MESIDQDNPFESPSEASNPSASLESIVHLARLGWLLPLIGIGLFVSMLLTVFLGIPTSIGFLILMGVLVCLAGGILFTIYGVFWAQTYRALWTHVTAALTANFVLMVIIGGVMFWLVAPVGPTGATPG